MSKRDISNFSDFRADENLGNRQPTKHDPLMCNLDLESEVRTYKAIDAISQIVSGIGLDYLEFSEVIGKLLHYYENLAEIEGVTVEELGYLQPVFDNTPQFLFEVDDDDFDG